MRKENKNGKKFNTECAICRKGFYVKPFFKKHGWGKYCSKKCQFQSQLKGKFIKCDVCGKQTWKMPKDIKHSKSGKFFCSKSHQTLWRNSFYSGPNHLFWTGGESVYRKILARTKTPLTCKHCGYNTDTRILVVHHKNNDRKNNKLSNLEWLCRNCHYLVHLKTRI